jgi:hypothetical protein
MLALPDLGRNKHSVTQPARLASVGPLHVPENDLSNYRHVDLCHRPSRVDRPTGFREDNIANEMAREQHDHHAVNRMLRTYHCQQLFPSEPSNHKAPV